MKGKLLAASAVILSLIATACVQTATSTPSSEASSRFQSASGVEMELVTADKRGPDLWLTICYQLPSEADWVPGRHADDAIVAIRGNSYPMSSLELVGWRFSAEGVRTHRCDRISFSVPEDVSDASYTATIERIAASLPPSVDCAEVQHRLDAAQTGIRIECLAGGEGLSYAVLEKPPSMTNLEAAHTVDDIAGDVVAGPWVFIFTAGE